MKHKWNKVAQGMPVKQLHSLTGVSVCCNCGVVKFTGQSPTPNPVKPHYYTKYIINGQVAHKAPPCENLVQSINTN